MTGVGAPATLNLQPLINAVNTLNRESRLSPNVGRGSYGF